MNNAPEKRDPCLVVPTALGDNPRERYLTCRQELFPGALSALTAEGFNLAALFCVENFENCAGFTLFYVLEKLASATCTVLQVTLAGRSAHSVSAVLPSACWPEREISDGFGIEFPNAPDCRHLFLHEVYPEGFHPLLKSFKNGPVVTRAQVMPEEEYPFREVTGEGVYQIPVGPVHAGIIEPGHFRFSVIGETVFNLETRMFYKHRGLEKLAEGKSATEGVVIAEAVSGDESAANAVAYCGAVEEICATDVPGRAWTLRTILLELERVYSHLGGLAGIVTDVAYPAGASRFQILREEVLRINHALTGSRFLKGILCPGGLRKEPDPDALLKLGHDLPVFLKKFNDAVQGTLSASSVIDRLERTGVIGRDIIASLNVSGPVARAAGAPVDTRLDHPYGIYHQLSLQKRTGDAGDVLSRFNVKAQEVQDSVGMVQQLLALLEPGPIFIAPTIRDGYAMSLVEAPRGQSFHWLYIKDRRIDRYKVRTPSYCNWPAIEHAVIGNIVPDFPVINKSFDLSYAGTDL